MTITVPNCSGLTPSLIAIGVSSGPNRIMAGAPSRIMPNTIMTTEAITTNAVAPYCAPNCVIVSDMRFGMRSMVSAYPSPDAAATMNRMLPVIDAACTKRRTTIFQVSSRKASPPTTNA